MKITAIVCLAILGLILGWLYIALNFNFNGF